MGEKANETKSCFFDRVTKVDTSLVRLTKKTKKAQMTKIRNDTTGYVDHEYNKISSFLYVIYEKLTINIKFIIINCNRNFNCEKLNPFPLKSRTQQRSLFSPF